MQSMRYWRVVREDKDWRKISAFICGNESGKWMHKIDGACKTKKKKEIVAQKEISEKRTRISALNITRIEEFLNEKFIS